MEIGRIRSVEDTVTEEKTAQSMGSGVVRVYSSPSMAALMEKAASDCILEYLGPERISVGVAISLRHLAATPVGMKVRAFAEITADNGKTVDFNIWAEDEFGRIGEGTHTRAMVNRMRFLERAYAKVDMNK